MSNTCLYTDLWVCILNGTPTVAQERGWGGWNIPPLSEDIIQSLNSLDKIMGGAYFERAHCLNICLYVS